MNLPIYSSILSLLLGIQCVAGVPVSGGGGRTMVDTVVETTIVTTTVLAYRTTKPEVSPCSYGKHTSRKSSVPAVMNSMSSSVGSSGYRNGTWPIPLLVTSSSALGPTFSSSPLSNVSPLPPTTAYNLNSADHQSHGTFTASYAPMSTPVTPSTTSTFSDKSAPILSSRSSTDSLSTPYIAAASKVRSSATEFSPTPAPTSKSMGQWSTKPATSGEEQTGPESWRQTLKHTVSTFGKSTSAAGQVPEDNIFVPIAQDNILPQIPIGRHHPVPRQGIEDNEDRTLHPNKFYANTFLGNQDMPVWTHPYSMWWGKGRTQEGQFPTWGMNIGHVETEDVIMPDGDPAQHYINPQKRQSLILTAQELGSETTLTTDTHLPFSVNINLNQNKDVWEPTITFPAVQGMSFVTGGYGNATPVIQCPGKGFREISGPFFVGKSTKYRIIDSHGRTWVAYINPIPTLAYDTTAFKATDSNTFVGPSGFKGTVQIAKNPFGAEGEAMYDKATGAFVCEASLEATVQETKGTYSLSYTKVGSSPLLMFLLPHHVQSLDPELRAQVTNLQLRTTTKGMATAIWADKVTFIEPNLPISMGFGPWTAATSPIRKGFSTLTLEIINAAAERDLRAAMDDKTPEDSMYYAGKTLARFATILWVLKEVVNNPIWTLGLERLKSELDRYVQNRQNYPLFYDDSWKGLVSNAGFTDPGADFGNTYYNDHHFHYGYFVYAAAVVGSLDPEWLNQGDNKVWVNSLVKDFAESDYHGRDYPFSRAFDWYHGHSWAKGLFESADGKDEESTSEDGFASFAVKMWGKVIGDVNMEKRGNLMLAIQARSFNQYFYMLSNNTNHPQRFIGNSVTGILFENKVDHATYFGVAPHLIHGIHMLPLSPASAYLRPKTFVREEWDRFFSNDRWKVEGGWRGVLMANLAIIDARSAWEFFRAGIDGDWDDNWIDGGASRSWYLTLCAGLGGAR